MPAKMLPTNPPEKSAPPAADCPEAEAHRLLQLTGGLRPALDVLMAQFNVLQSRSHLLLTLGTLALTITGFSGPKIAASGAFPRYALAAGLVLVLAALIMIIRGGLAIRWVTQFHGATAEEQVLAVIHYRNTKTHAYFSQTLVLTAGLTCYVLAIVFYFLFTHEV